MIQERREYLLETIELDKEHKLRILKVRSRHNQTVHTHTHIPANGMVSHGNNWFSFDCTQEQQINCTGKLQQTTGLIQFCIEALKETDNAAFLQVGSTTICSQIAM